MPHVSRYRAVVEPLYTRTHTHTLGVYTKIVEMIEFLSGASRTPPDKICISAWTPEPATMCRSVMKVNEALDEQATLSFSDRCDSFFFFLFFFLSSPALKLVTHLP